MEINTTEQMYKMLFDRALANVDKVFQIESTLPDPILPDFCEIGEDKFAAVVRLADAYKKCRRTMQRLEHGAKADHKRIKELEDQLVTEVENLREENLELSDLVVAQALQLGARK